MTDVGRRPRVRMAGDTLLLVEFEPAIDLATNRRAIALAHAIAAAALPGTRDVVPAYASVGVHFDPLRFDPAALDALVSRVSDAAGAHSSVGERIVEVPVSYGGADGPDLEAVAAFASCSVGEVILRHTAPLYRVYMLGFLPGFAYLGTVDPTIAMPRRDTPRARVLSGSVGIAGRQTGVYPCDSPGGWNLVGRTPARVFDPDRAAPALLAPGDLVRFVATTPETWAGEPAGTA